MINRLTGKKKRNNTNGNDSNALVQIRKKKSNIREKLIPTRPKTPNNTISHKCLQIVQAQKFCDKTMNTHLYFFVCKSIWVNLE